MCTGLKGSATKMCKIISSVKLLKQCMMLAFSIFFPLFRSSEQTQQRTKNRREVLFVKMTILYCENAILGPLRTGVVSVLIRDSGIGAMSLTHGVRRISGHAATTNQLVDCLVLVEFHESLDK